MNIVKFGDVASRLNIHVDQATTTLEYYIGGEHINSCEFMVHKKAPIKGATIGYQFQFGFEKGDILFMTKNPHLRKASMVDFDGLCSIATFVIRSNDESVLLQKYLLLEMQSDRFWDYCEEHKSGGVNYFINWGTLSNYEFPLPPISEQKVLAEKLWAAYEVKQSYLKMIEATQEMVKSQFIEMMSHRCTTKKKVGEVADVMTGSTPSRNHPEYWEGSKCWVAAQDMGCKYVVDTKEKLTDEGYATCKIVSAGSVLYVCRGSIGVISINTMDCATNQSICTATCKDGYENEFLYYALKFAENDIKKQGTGTSFKSLNQSSFSAIELNFPSSEDQKSFVSIAHQADKSEFELRKSIKAIDAVIKSLINS